MYDPLSNNWYESRFKMKIAGKDSHTLEFWEPGRGGEYYLTMQMVYTRRGR